MTNLDILIEAIDVGNASDLHFHTWRPGLTGTKKESNAMLRAYGGSLDAALSLHLALLPDAKWWIGQEAASVMLPDDFLDPAAEPFTGYSTNPARAWLLAIMKAYRAGAKP